jgi:hypothetical protein
MEALTEILQPEKKELFRLFHCLEFPLRKDYSEDTRTVEKA